MIVFRKRCYQCYTLEVMMKKYIELIKKVELLESISLEDVNSYITDGSFRINKYEKNNIIHFVGDPCSKLEIILMGKVVIERIDEAGNLMTITEFFGGDILGGNLLFSKNPNFPMTVTAKEASIILEIEVSRLFSLFSENQDFLKSYLQYVSDNTVILSDRIKHFVNRTIRESIISFLNFERIKQNSNHIKLNMTKKALAERIGVQRTSLSRELSKMRDEGLINYDSKTIKILNSEIFED